ncbi:uncharacterized protein MYCGRDRAFT_43924 [Zymoseptoria tritici IPO323]|uniref:ATP-dependent DNA helicase n=1 Tax=Zymoseptoria tritici (strain CBS 115943 / IPO323) TaxID=336722 RepID=F9XE11_ZYMTI|nr:uncharacterized protein MYCGRDRAFT_43924 [Zymoseptoria tritici IPO323]EGP86712.1 hypothetical protein MYCGRDRAFT_43924 [Zymoseptoria tritici IPO323]
MLSAAQRAIYNKVLKHARAQIVTRQVVAPLLLNINSKAGTSKSFIIEVISAHLQALISNYEDVIFCAAPTGAASYSIAGLTLHTLLRLPTKGEFHLLGVRQLAHLQRKLRRVLYIIINKKSIVGLETLDRV